MPEIEVSFSYTMNLGNYESAKIQMGLSRELAKGETKEVMIDKKFNFISNQVFDQIDKLVDKKGDKKMTEIYTEFSHIITVGEAENHTILRCELKTDETKETIKEFENIVRQMFTEIEMIKGEKK